MDIDFWLERWESEQTGFHQHTINPYLIYFYGDKGPSIEQREKLKVFVPLCGKSSDMLWLSQNHYRVFGVECSERAVKSFFEENAVSYKHADVGEYSLYQSSELAATIEIFRGDFFALQASDLEDVSDIFDRASLIALPLAMREQYVSKMIELQKPGVRSLLITLTYDESEMDGPPFSVDEDHVMQMYAEHFTVDKLCFNNIIDNEPRFKERGVSQLVETVYKLVRK